MHIPQINILITQKKFSFFKFNRFHEKNMRILVANGLQQRLEKNIASFLGVEDAICFPMGFGTNSMNICALVDKVKKIDLHKCIFANK